MRPSSTLLRRGLVGILGALAAIAIVPSQAGAAASLIGDYRFDDNLSSSIPGAPPLNEISPPGTYSTATVHGAADRVLSWPEGGGLQLPQSALSSPSTYSTIVTFAFDDVSYYRRILAFDTYANDSDYGVYDLDGTLGFYDGVIDPFGSSTVFQNGVFTDVAFTRTAGGRVGLFADGALQVAYQDSGLYSVVQSDGLRYFKDDTSNENGSGRVARIRVYDGALTDAQVAEIQQNGGLLPSAASVASPKPIKRKKGKPVKKVATGLTATCPPEGVPCPFTASVSATKKGKVRQIGTRTGEVPAGTTGGPFKVKLSDKGRKLIARKGKLPITVEDNVTASSGNTATATGSGKF